MECRGPAGAGTPGCVKGEGLRVTTLFDALTRTATERSRRANLTDLPSISVIWIETATVISPLKKHHKDRRKGAAAVTEKGAVS